MWFDNKKFCNHNMAGGFDGMEVTHALTHDASAQNALASVMEVK